MNYDENAICKAYGKRMMLMPIPFILGGIIDIQYHRIGCLIAWVIWFIMFILLLMDRQKRESLQQNRGVQFQFVDVIADLKSEISVQQQIPGIKEKFKEIS